MKITRKLIVGSAFALMLSATAGAATVTLQMSSGLTNAVNFANAEGTAKAGLAWGIIVDTAGGGINFDNLNGTVLSTSTSGIQLGGSDDYLFISGNLSGTLPNVPGFGAEALATGQLSNIAGIVIGEPASNPVNTGQAFTLIWFGDGVTRTSTLSDGATYGIVENGAFTIPAGGATFSYAAAVFSANPDPVRPANLLIGVPEPSVAILGALGLLGLVRRRR